MIVDPMITVPLFVVNEYGVMLFRAFPLSFAMCFSLQPCWQVNVSSAAPLSTLLPLGR
jgi:hypothetical protein